MSYGKYMAMAVFGIGLVLGCAALLAAVLDNDGGSDNFGTIFAVTAGISGIVLGIGLDSPDSAAVTRRSVKLPSLFARGTRGRPKTSPRASCSQAMRRSSYCQSSVSGCTDPACSPRWNPSSSTREPWTVGGC